MDRQTSVLFALIAFAAAGMILAGIIGMKVGRWSRKKEEKHDALVNSLMDSAPQRYGIMLGNRFTPPPEDPKWKMPPRDGQGRFLPKKVQ